MIDILNFVKGAVARKDFVPALQHFQIKAGHITSFNGTLGLRSPIPVQIDCCPHALAFVRAIEACREAVTLSLTDTGRLLVRSGRFKTFVPTVDPASYPPLLPEGKRVPVNDSLLPALRFLEPYIAEDASRPWACGIMLNETSAYATNNIVLLQYWLGFDFPGRINLPAAAVRELLRIGEDPKEVQFTESNEGYNRVTFHYGPGRWLTSQLYTDPWPDTEPLLNRDSAQAALPTGFFEALEELSPFLDELGRVYFHGDRMSTSDQPDKDGTTLELSGLPAAGCFNGRQLLNLRGNLETIDLASYPQPSLFYGGQARGLIVGIRTQ